MRIDAFTLISLAIIAVQAYSNFRLTKRCKELDETCNEQFEVIKHHKMQ